MMHGKVALCVAMGLCCAWPRSAHGEDFTDILKASNEVIARSNEVRERVKNGDLANGEAKRAVAELLPALDDLDARAIRACAEAPTAENIASLADLILHGSLLQCLYALSAKDSEFEAGLGYGTVYDQLLVLTDIDFRRGGAVNDPQGLLEPFQDFFPPTVAQPWIGDGALAALDDLQAARAAVFAGDRTPKALLSHLPELNAASRAALDRFLQERNRDYLAVDLAGKFYALEVCCFALMEPRNPGEGAWGHLANVFGECGKRAPLPPGALLDLFQPPEGFEGWDEGPQGLRAWIIREVKKLFDNFNKRQPWLWRRPEQETGVTVERRNGRLVIKGRSDGRGKASGLWTHGYAPMRGKFLVDMAGKGDGYHMHMRISGDSGAYVTLAFGGSWAPTTFEIWRDGDSRPHRAQAFVKEASAFDERAPFHTGEIWYNPDNGRVRALLDGVVLGEAGVNFGDTVTYAIYCSSDKPVEYDAWFDNFLVTPPVER